MTWLCRALFSMQRMLKQYTNTVCVRQEVVCGVSGVSNLGLGLLRYGERRGDRLRERLLETRKQTHHIMVHCRSGCLGKLLFTPGNTERER